MEAPIVRFFLKTPINGGERLRAERYHTFEASGETGDGFLSRVWNGTANDVGAIDEFMMDDYQLHSVRTACRRLDGARGS
jgi:hypothetical protein